MSKFNGILASAVERTRRLWVMFTQTEENHPLVSAYAVAGVWVFMTIYTVQRVQLPFHHDSLYYWELGGSFIVNGQFSFNNFTDGLRGYLFPFLLFIVQWQASVLGLDAKFLFAIYSAVFFTLFTMCLVPWFFGTVFRSKTSAANRIALAFLVFFFWRGHFLYPLTDFPSLAALLVGSTLLARAVGSSKSGIWVLLAGVFAGAALNIRPIYQISFLVMLVFSLFAWSREATGKVVSSMALLLLGCGIVLVPQWIINRTHLQSNSPLVLATYMDDANIYEVQLFWGLRTQKYETNIGENYPSAAVVYEDPFSDKLSKIGAQEKNLQNYLSIIKKHPVDAAISFFRHAFNGLDPFYATPYVRNIYAEHALFSLINYLIWFVMLLHVIRLEVDRISFMGSAAVFSLAAPVLLAIPTVVEVRFFLPLYVLAYGVTGYAFEYLRIWTELSRNKWHRFLLPCLCILWVMLCFALSASVSERLLVVE